MSLAGKIMRSQWRRPAIAAALSLLTVVLLLSACARHVAASSHSPRELGRITFTAAGDVIPHQAVREAAAAAAAPGNHEGWDALFADVADLFRAADYGFVNFETPLAPDSSHGTRAFLFNAPLPLADSLYANGVRVVSFANNHVFDQGHAGFAESLGRLQKAGLLYVGAAPNAQDELKPLILEKNGVRVGWLGATRWLNGGRNPEDARVPHVAFLPYTDAGDGAPGLTEEQFLAGVAAARQQCDLLIVSIHWGVEYAPAPRPQDSELAHKILDAGASLILGHHPHVLQPVETYRTKDQRNAVVFYSLGNFLSNQSRNYVNGLMPDKEGDPRDELIVRFSVIKKDYGPAGIQTELGDVGIYPVWMENNRLALGSGADARPSIHPVLIDREIPRLEASLAALQKLPQPLEAKSKAELLRLNKQLELLQHRRELLLERTGDEFLALPPAPAR
jgi:poly-gamma-glutamate synthesis protein (capsule biosynthesis protein)